MPLRSIAARPNRDKFRISDPTEEGHRRFMDRRRSHELPRFSQRAPEAYDSPMTAPKVLEHELTAAIVGACVDPVFAVALGSLLCNGPGNWSLFGTCNGGSV